ncbi:MAG: hypothetical protein MJZ61_07790 [Bacteroidales bacterium]|nr:hypothetical protein [Bacteroidales bacterium]
MENTQQIYQEITRLAEKLKSAQSTITRADLAYELKKLGIPGDSPEISRLVWQCYQQTGCQAITEAFVNNSKTSSIIDEYKIPALLEGGQEQSAFETIAQKLRNTDTTLGQLSQLIDEKTKLQLVEAASTLMNVVSGTNAVHKIQSEASQIFNQYSQMAGRYQEATSSIRSLTGDFCELRQSTTELYRKYANTLIDIFGDRIKATMPEMFDFASIKFLDVEGMLKTQQLGYNSIYGKCADLVGNVSEGFTKALRQGVSQFGAQQDKRVGLVLAGINLISHYMKTGQQTQNLRHELQELKSSITHDVAAIRTDEVRLTEIFQTLNNVLIPKAEIFAKAAPEVFDNELQQLLDTLYTGEAANLRSRREEIIVQLRKLERRINDEQMSINYYTSHVADCRETLQSLEEPYQKAKNDKPIPPSGLGNVLSFGTAKKNYNRDIYDWTQNCAPLVSQYEDLIVDIKVDSEELAAQQKALDTDKQQYTLLLAELQQINDKLQQQLKASPEAKVKVLSHLGDIIKLLQIAKDVSSAKLDDRLINTYTVKKFKDIQLPENLQKAVTEFKDEITRDMDFTEQDARNLAGKITAEQAAQIASDGKDILSKGISICETMAHLSAMQVNQGLAQEYYDREFQKIKDEFQQNIKAVDNQAQILQEIARRINTAPNKDELKQSLLQLLGNSGNTLTAQDFDDFLAGRKTISI